MKKVLMFWVVLLLVCMVASLLVSCRDDIFVEPPPSLIGRYSGIYQYTKIENGIDTTVDTSQLITWRFTLSGYQMRKDTTIPESVRVFCDVDGQYELENGVTLIQEDSNVTRGVCTFDQNPSEFFGLDQSSGDSTFLTQDLTDVNGNRTIKLIRLRKR